MCLSDPDNGGFACYNQATGDEFFLKYEDSENWVTTHPDDFKAILDYMKYRCVGKDEQAGLFH